MRSLQLKSPDAIATGSVFAAWRRPGVLLAAGAAAFLLVLASYLLFTTSEPSYLWSSPVDLHVYRFAGLIARHAPPYDPRLASPLYDWPGYMRLKFTYPPFSALVFTLLTLPKWSVVPDLTMGASILALVAAIWATLGGLGYRAGATRLGGTLLIAAAMLWTEPVQRTLYLGQIELVLMALIMWDMCQSDRSWWKGAGVGIAAGIKLVPGIFILYLLLTRRFRQAAVAAGTFAATILLGFVLLPADSRAWWFDGLFVKANRTGFVGWEGNQSLQGIITRLSGSIAAGQPIWLAVAACTLVAGLFAAAVLHRAGQPVLGVLTCALTGLLVSPISWDHHWVWIAPAVTVLAVFGIRARGRLRWAYLASAVLITGLFGGWPESLWGRHMAPSAGFALGIIWAPPNTRPRTFASLGDRPWYSEYHWHGFEVLTGNLYVLIGMALFAVILFAALRVRARPETVSTSGPAAGSDAGLGWAGRPAHS